MKSVVFIYVFLFACLFKMHATQPQPKTQQQPKDCVKHPQIVKATPEKSKVVTEKVVKSTTSYRGAASIPHFSVLNFINFFYTKDTLDNLHVM
ncbi:MAG: hypothetical protein K0R26_2660 [Bacteroidota bacterium]|jgi:hypothetical protein|nr:hypothetical protein [Bacteroidota bacterium]